MKRVVHIATLYLTLVIVAGFVIVRLDHVSFVLAFGTAAVSAFFKTIAVRLHEWAWRRAQCRRTIEAVTDQVCQAETMTF